MDRQTASDDTSQRNVDARCIGRGRLVQTLSRISKQRLRGPTMIDGGAGFHQGGGTDRHAETTASTPRRQLECAGHLSLAVD